MLLRLLVTLVQLNSCGMPHVKYSIRRWTFGVVNRLVFLTTSLRCKSSTWRVRNVSNIEVAVFGVCSEVSKSRVLREMVDLVGDPEFSMVNPVIVNPWGLHDRSRNGLNCTSLRLPWLRVAQPAQRR